MFRRDMTFDADTDPTTAMPAAEPPASSRELPPTAGPAEATSPNGLLIPPETAGLSPFGSQPLPPPKLPRPPVPVRTIMATIALVFAAYVGVRTLQRLHRLIGWTVVACLLAVVMSPIVDRLQRRTRMRRGYAVAIVFLAFLAIVVGLVALFVTPVAARAPKFWNDLPENISAAGRGRGPFAKLVSTLNLEGFVRDHETDIRNELSDLGSASLGTVRAVLGTILAVVTVLTMTVLLLVQGPTLCDGISSLIPERHRERVSRVSSDVSRAVSHYMLGNLLISLIAGTAAFLAMLVLGVPNALILALWIAFTDLIPLIGATLGALPAVLIAALQSGRDAIILAIFFLIYQQFENHVLQVVIMARAVKLNSLLVLVAVLVGVELFGFLGAFLAIPVAGALQVVVQDIWDTRRGRARAEPSTTAPDPGADPPRPSALPRWWRLTPRSGPSGA
jgi:predicted PurR-regulated permease PerM